jgi:hypothetical protein
MTYPTQSQQPAVDQPGQYRTDQPAAGGAAADVQQPAAPRLPADSQPPAPADVPAPAGADVSGAGGADETEQGAIAREWSGADPARAVEDGGQGDTSADDGTDNADRTAEPDRSGAPVQAGPDVTAGDGADAGEPDRAPSDGQLAPGASATDPVAALWGADLVSRYRGQWQLLQLRFVDDPHTATREAAGLVDDAVHSLTSSLEEQKRGLDDWQADDTDDTEVMRVALRRYRDFLDRLLGM